MKILKHFRQRRSALLSSLLTALLLVAPLTKSVWSVEVRQTPPQRDTIVFIVSGESGVPGAQRTYSMDALAILKDGKFLSPMAEDDKKSQQGFADAFYRKGQQYRLLFGGGEVGTATVQGWSEGCNAIHSSISVKTSANIRGRIYGLATNSESLGKKASSRRALTTAERAAVLTLVNSIYLQNKTPNALMRSLKVGNLTATDLDGDGQFEVIGDFQIQTGNEASGARRDLFLIATPEGKGFRAELANFNSYKMDSGFGQSIGFLDQLDMDGDGLAEVVTINEGFDAYGYSIYKKENGKWRDVYDGAGDAC